MKAIRSPLVGAGPGITAGVPVAGGVSVVAGVDVAGGVGAGIGVGTGVGAALGVVVWVRMNVGVAVGSPAHPARVNMDTTEIARKRDLCMDSHNLVPESHDGDLEDKIIASMEDLPSRLAKGAST